MLNLRACVFFLLLTSVLNGQFDPVSDITKCKQYVLPEISGNALSGQEYYYTRSSGITNPFNPGDTLFSSDLVYIFDPDNPQIEEECFYLSIIDQAPLFDVKDTIDACDYYQLVIPLGNNLTKDFAYYTEPNRNGKKYLAGQFLYESTELYMADGQGDCYTEQKVYIDIPPKPVLSKLKRRIYCDYSILEHPEGINLPHNPTFRHLESGVVYRIGDTIDFTGQIEIVADTAACVESRIEYISHRVIPDTTLPPVEYCQKFPLHDFLSDFEIDLEDRDIVWNDPSTPSGWDDLFGSETIGSHNDTLIVTKFTEDNCQNRIKIPIRGVPQPRMPNDIRINLCRGPEYDIEIIFGKFNSFNFNYNPILYNSIFQEVDKELNSAEVTEDSLIFYMVRTTESPCDPIRDTIKARFDFFDDCQNPDLFLTMEACKFRTSLITEPENWIYGGSFTFKGESSSEYGIGHSVSNERLEIGLNYIEYKVINSEGEEFTSTTRIEKYPPLEVIGVKDLCWKECTELSFDLDAYPLNLDSIILFIWSLNSVHGPSGFAEKNKITVCADNSKSSNFDTVFLPSPMETYPFLFQLLSFSDHNSCSFNQITINTSDANVYYIQDQLCPDESIEINGEVFNIQRPAGEVKIDEPAQDGCDSFVIVDLKFYEESISYINYAVCDEDTITINCIDYYDGFSQDIQVIEGGDNRCDSTIVIDITFASIDTMHLDTSLCNEEELYLGNELVPDTSTSWTIKNQFGCDSIYYILQISRAISQLTGIKDSFACEEGKQFLIVSNADSIMWSTGETANTIEAKKTGTYFVTVTSNQCTVVDSFNVNPVSNPTINLDSVMHFVPGIEITLAPEIIGTYDSLRWFNIASSCPSCRTQNINPVEEQTIVLEVYYQNTCMVTKTIALKKVKQEIDLILPNIVSLNPVTPENGIFYLKTEESGIRYDIMVVDRWGNMIFSKKDIPANEQDEGWRVADFQNQIVTGVYLYKITIYNDEEEEVLFGDLTLIN